jgi:hypothetical protein
MLHTCIPHIQEAKARGSQVQDQPRLYSKMPQKKKKKEEYSKMVARGRKQKASLL